MLDSCKEEGEILTQEDLLSQPFKSTLITLAPSNNPTPESALSLAKALLSNGCKTVILLKSHSAGSTMEKVYSRLIEGDSLIDSINSDQLNQDIIIYGQNIRIPNNNGLLSHALRIMLNTPDECREAFRVILHLVSPIMSSSSSPQSLGCSINEWGEL